MDHTSTGTVHGNTIVLDQPPPGMEGQTVEVTIRQAQAKAPWGEGIRASAGSLANHPELDAIMERIYAERKLERRNPVEP